MAIGGPLLIVILAGGALIGLGIWSLFQTLSSAIPSENYSSGAKVSVSRLVSCGIGCPDLNNTGFISNYPELKEALNQKDTKFFQKVSDSDCHRNDCMGILFSNDTVDFAMPRDRASRMTNDLMAYGAEQVDLCFEGGCFTLEFRVNGEALYHVAVDYRIETLKHFVEKQ